MRNPARKRDVIDVRPDNIRWFDECGPFTQVESEALLTAQRAIMGKTDAVDQLRYKSSTLAPRLQSVEPPIRLPGCIPEPPPIPSGAGWGIFSAQVGPEWQLQRDDAENIFATDDKAWLHVVTMAASGSALEREALEWLADTCPLEIETIAKMFPVVKDVIAQIKA